MQHKIILLRTYATEFIVDAEDDAEARKKFDAMGDTIYQVELEQCNVVSQNILIESEEDSKRVCSVTDEDMTEGWVVNDGELYFKYEKDAIQWSIDNGYDGLQSAYDDDVIYWTTWDE